MSCISYFDAIPHEVHKRIATFILASSKCDALSFSKSCEIHRSAMAAVLEEKLAFTDADADHLEDWISIVGRNVQELDFYSLRRYSLPPTFHTLPNLKVASIYGRSDQFRAILYSPNLTKLTVMFNGNMDWEEMLSAVSRLPLHELRIKGDWQNACIMSLIPDSMLLMLPSACPLVTLLEMDCRCRSKSIPHWQIVTSFKALDSLILRRKFSETHIPFLRKLKDIRISFPLPIRKLVQLGPNLSTVTQLRRANFRTVSLLSALPRLRELRVRLLDGAEKALVGVVTQLEGLSLEWGYDERNDGTMDEGYEDGDVTVGKDATAYYPLDEAWLEGIIREAPNLRVVLLNGAVIKLEAVEKVMKLIGERLFVFGANIDGQKESPGARLEGILRTAERFCPNIDRIEIPIVPTLFPTQGHVTQQQKDNCLVHLDRIKRNAPFFQTEQIKRKIDLFEVLD